MYKQSAFVIAMLMGSSAARRQAPKSVSLFATGVEDNEVLDVNVKDEDLSPEKVSILETTKAQNHTTFYGQQGEKKPADEKKIQLSGDDLGLLHEKVTVLNEEYFRHRNDKKDSIFNYPEDDFERTTFYTQLKDDDLSPEKVSILETTKAQNHTTFYGQHDTKNKKKVEPVGSGNIANTHAQRKKKDIGEVGIEPNVHAFASDEVNALKNIREDEAYDLNGSGEKGWGKAFVQRKKKDIGEVGIEPNVHAFASDEVAALKNIREDEKYDLNGSADNGWGKAFVQRSIQKNMNDVKNQDIRPDVWKVTFDNVSAVPEYRSDSAPAYTYEPYKEPSESAQIGLRQEPAEEPPAAAEPEVKKTETKNSENPETGEVEKVSVIDPITHQISANTNKPNARTTFYSQKVYYDAKNGIWMTGDDSNASSKLQF